MTRVARECCVIAKEPEAQYAWWWGSHTLHVIATVARNDDDATDWWCAAESREAARPRWKHKEPVPRKEGRLH